MSSRKVVKWFGVSRDTGPLQNHRLNPIILDFRSDELLGGTPIANAVATVNRIVASYPAPYTLLVSGGIDSQVMLWAWKLSGIPFRAVHYSYGTNASDMVSVVEFCELQQIDLEILHFDALGFITSPKLVEMAKRYDCSSPQILTYIEFTRAHSETCVMSGNFVQPQSAGINWTIYGLERFAQLEKPNFIPFFLLSSPQLAYSFYHLDIKFKYEMFSKTGEKDDYISKTKSYLAAGFPVIPQKQKFTGFEEIKESYDSVAVPGLLRMKWSGMPSKRPFDILFRYSLYDHTGKYAETYRLVHHRGINTRVPQH